MTPLKFDATTAREVCGDDAAREIEAKARADADQQRYEPPAGPQASTYWGEAQAQMREIVYREQYAKRVARNERKRLTPLTGV